ncbi:hypothetical protein V1291_004660 [Nitrobacteraceae bacterium AZCC 1564]
MVTDVITAAIVGMNLGRGIVSIDGMWQAIDPFVKHLSIVAFHVLLQNFLLSVCHSG